LIEARRSEIETKQYTSAAAPASILATLDALEVRAGIHVLWNDGPIEAARRLEGLVRMFTRGIEKDCKRLMLAQAEVAEAAE
jgi:hypothetical protein